MVKTAHASRIEKCKTLMKKVRAGKRKAQLKLNLLTEEERKAKEDKRRAFTLDEKIRLLEWDYNHHQLPFVKQGYLHDLIEEKLNSEDIIIDDRRIELTRLLKKLK